METGRVLPSGTSGYTLGVGVGWQFERRNVGIFNEIPFQLLWFYRPQIGIGNGTEFDCNITGEMTGFTGAIGLFPGIKQQVTDTSHSGTAFGLRSGGLFRIIGAGTAGGASATLVSQLRWVGSVDVDQDLALYVAPYALFERDLQWNGNSDEKSDVSSWSFGTSLGTRVDMNIDEKKSVYGFAEGEALFTPVQSDTPRRSLRVVPHIGFQSVNKGEVQKPNKP